MPVFRSTESTSFELHGSCFNSYVAPPRGSSQLFAWRLDLPSALEGLDLPSALEGVAHRPNREEVILVLNGELRVTLDGILSHLLPGDVALVSAHSELPIDAGPHGASAWVTTTPGLGATTDDGTRIAPPWAA
jgi:hypothetical protein